MDKPKMETKTYRKIMPLKGSLLQKLKNQFKKEKNDETKANNGVIDSINNNVDQNSDPVHTEENKSPQQKVIIQKVENVHIDAIQTPSGPVRRISSFFVEPFPKPDMNNEEFKTVIVDTGDATDAVPAETKFALGNSPTIPKATRSPIKLLSVKMPENSFNQSVSLKMTRVLKQPKPKPVLKNRYHRVQAFKQAEPPVGQGSIVRGTIVDNDIKFEILVPDVEMSEPLEAPAQNNPLPAVIQLVQDTDNHCSDSDESFHGFDPKDVKESLDDLMLWSSVLKEKSLTTTTENPLEKSFKQEPVVEPSVLAELPKPTKSPEPSDDDKKDNKQIELIEPTKVSKRASRNVSKSKTEPTPKVKEIKKKEVAPVPVVISEQSTEKPVKQTKSTEKMETLPIIPEPSHQSTPSTTLESLPIPSTSKEISKEKPQTKLSSWQTDILAVIGLSRIEKIDENLQNIPNLLSDNIYETEIIELKLIVNHLLRILKVDSVKETIKLAVPTSDNEDSFGEQDDDFSDSFGDDSNPPSFLDHSTDNEGCPSGLEDNNLRSSSRNINFTATSNFYSATNNDESTMEESTTLEVPEVTINTPNKALEARKAKLTRSQELIASCVSPVADELDISVGNVQPQDQTNEGKVRSRKRKTSSSKGPPAKKQLKSSKQKKSDAESVKVQSETFAVTAKSEEKVVKSEGVQSEKEVTNASPRKARGRPTKVHCNQLTSIVNERKMSLRSSQSESEGEGTARFNELQAQTKELKHSELRCNGIESHGFDKGTPNATEKHRIISNPRRSLKKDKTTYKADKLLIASRRSSLRSSSCGSTSETSLSPVKLTKEKPVLRKRSINSGSESSLEGVRRRHVRAKPIQPLSDDSDSNDDLSQPLHQHTSSDSSIKTTSTIKRTRRVKKEKPTKVYKPRLSSKIIDSDSDSEDNQQTSRNAELKSRLSAHDSNSNDHSSFSPRNNCLASLDTKGNKSDVRKLIDKIATVVSKTKSIDPTYIAPPIFEKRERLRTSAFKGNKDNQSDSEPDKREPSVSREPPVADASISKILARTKKRQSKAFGDEDINRRVFEQEKLEPAIEDRVPYKSIVLAIRASVPTRRTGRLDLKKKEELEKKKAEDLKGLKAMKYFRCGSCHHEVSKHKWRDHFQDHGGIAWIEGIEHPIDLNDWNEALRRTINNLKAYELSSLVCPNCKQEKKSALGHLSHAIICCESDETIEGRMIECELCKEKILPYNVTPHRGKCPGIQKVQEVKEDKQQSNSSDEEVTAEDFNSSGRTKRKAVKRAEKKFKKIHAVLNKPSDQLKVVKGIIKCILCGETDFESQEEAIEHVNAEHGNSDGELEASSGSEGEMHGDESSDDETEGSSGDESSEIESDDDEEQSDNGDGVVSSTKKGKASTTESPECKYARGLLAEYVEDLRDVNIKNKTIQWTKQFFEENWKAEVLPQILPRFNLTNVGDPKIILPSLNFKLNSSKFGTIALQKYSDRYNEPYDKEWRQLEIGEQYADQESSTIYCGGSVAAVDWAPTDGDLNFLAVACNSNQGGVKLNMTESVKSCLQLYEFKDLLNDKSKAHTSKLCYVIIVNDGPIWCIKFHPSESSIEKRIGLLAVTTSNQSVVVYSLPYLNDHKSIVLPLEPKIVCKLDEGVMLYNDSFLLQASKVTWYQTNNSDIILAAGFISGMVGVWSLSCQEIEENNNAIYPQHVIQAHLEPITSLDFKVTTGTQYHLLTASLDRKCKVYTFDEVGYQEILSYYAESRVQCAEWLMHWPGFLIGLDDCFTMTKLMYRQPLEFGMRNMPLLSLNSTIVHLNVNHWLNVAVFVTDSGDVIGCNPNQMLVQAQTKDKWPYYKFKIFCSNDVNKIASDSGVEENGIIFGDFKGKSPQPKQFRLSPTDSINELQINQVCFNRNEKSYRFFALGFETGFVRIRYLKNSK